MSEYSDFFQVAEQLVNMEIGLMQEVITKFSTEGGLQIIKLLVEVPYSSGGCGQRVFESQIMPFFKVIGKQEVLNSLLLEQQVATIYNFLFGVGGSRSALLFKYVAEMLSASAITQSEAFISTLEYCVIVFSKMLDLNTLASVQASLAESAKKIEKTFLEASETRTAAELAVSEHYIRRLFARLNLGISLPAVSLTTSKDKKKQTSAFPIHRDPPGGRHDNDFEDIVRISILPTSGEINSRRLEYLPNNDPSTWHVGGVTGLLDRNFRLLREDQIGPLRDAVHQHDQDNSKRTQPAAVKLKEGCRTYVYANATIARVSLGRATGFSFQVNFPQPRQVQDLSYKKRQEWWERSKRLKPDSLICIVEKDGGVFFCTVVHPPRGNGNHYGATPPQQASLCADGRVASVSLCLVDENDENVDLILKHWSRDTHMKKLSVVEFPGVMLPAFYYTLRALQKISSSGEMPFADLLAPSGIEGFVEVPPPVYSRAAGFSFNLQSVMSQGEMSFTAGKPFDLDLFVESSSLDKSQALSLTDALSHQLALIEGPPGTGKSFTGVAFLKVVLSSTSKSRSRLGPIICICHTNHALDQLLEDFLDSDVTKSVIRVGSQSKSARLEKHNLRYVATSLEKTSNEKREYAITCSEMERLEEEFADLSSERQHVHTHKGVVRFLKKEKPGIYWQLFGKDEEGYQTVGAEKPAGALKAWLYGSVPDGNSQKQYNSPLDLKSLSQSARKGHYYSWIAKNKRQLDDRIKEIREEFAAVQERQGRIRDEQDLRCLGQADVIGITTSGLARKVEVLRRVTSKVALCEEAGEVLEPHVLAALIPSLEHLVLIGDHNQLRPQVQNFDLSRENPRTGLTRSLDVSLFERLVRPNVENAIRLPYSTLETQRRMHPSISRLVRETIYPNLIDHEMVLDYPEVAGMKNRLFWLDHQEYESNHGDDATGTSHWNDFEIEMVTALVSHLIQQGTYKAGEIAVLTPYLGQLFRLRQRLSESFAITVDERDEKDLEQAGFADEQGNTSAARSNLLHALRAATIDNFQGEEAKVIVISLVRSNPQHKCGFLKTSNRINVLLSRAKHGMYIIGNAQTSIHVDMWAKVIHILQSEGNFGPELQLQCPRHPERELMVSKPDHFTIMSPEGGCNERCIQRLPCGHACLKKCHSMLLHKAVHCLEPCQRPLKGCDHSCPKPCGDPCPTKCTVNVKDPSRQLPCGHTKQILPCWKSQDLSKVLCEVKVQRTVSGCNHIVEVSCYEKTDIPGYQCPQECGQLLPCGHACRKRCSQCRTHDGEKQVTDHGSCDLPCGRSFTNCSHYCRETCHGEQPCAPCSAPCDVRCGHSRCQKKCYEPCTPCAEEKCLSFCPHSACSLPCAAPCDHIPCSKRCESLLECNHQCPSICGEVCPSVQFCQLCASDAIREKEVDLLENKTYAEIDLDANPCIFPTCGHFLTVESMDGLMSMSEYYETTLRNDVEVILALKPSVRPFSMKDIKTCPTCRGSLRNLSRYGRLVRRALLDESTKRLIIWTIQTFVPLSNELPGHLEIARSFGDKNVPPNGQSISFDLSAANNSRDAQISRVGKILECYDPKAWSRLRTFRTKVNKFRSNVKVSEQPFSRVRDAVRAAHQRKGQGEKAEFAFDESVLQTKGFLQATSLLIRLDIAILSTFVSLKRPSGAGKPDIKLDTWLKDCHTFYNAACNTNRVVQQVEAFIFLAHIVTILKGLTMEPAAAERYQHGVKTYIASGRALCAKFPSQTKGLLDEIDQIETMLREATFYGLVTSEERLEVVRAMAAEMQGTGHWYYCANDHPFTIGECGMAMQRAICPECGAPVGGQNHQSVEGNRRADDIEADLRNTHL